jgi:hypothetical protein
VFRRRPPRPLPSGPNWLASSYARQRLAHVRPRRFGLVSIDDLNSLDDRTGRGVVAGQQRIRPQQRCMHASRRAGDDAGRQLAEGAPGALRPPLLLRRAGTASGPFRPQGSQVRRRLAAGGGSPLRTRLRKVKIPESGFVSILGWVLDDSGIVKHCFALIICRETVPLSLAAGPALSGLKPLLSRLFRRTGVEGSG